MTSVNCERSGLGTQKTVPTFPLHVFWDSQNVAGVRWSPLRRRAHSSLLYAFDSTMRGRLADERIQGERAGVATAPQTRVTDDWSSLLY